MEGLTILFRNQNYVAVNKPSGLFVHRSPLDRRAPFALQRVRDMVGCRVYPVHRLDRPTSGVLLFGLCRESAAKLCLCFREKRIEKTYLAVVRGYTEGAGRIDYPLRADRDAPLKNAITDFKTLKTMELPVPLGRYDTTRYSLVRARPQTGRTHQIRKHFAHIFHPIVGDTVHGDGRHNRFFRDQFNIHRLLLAATELKFQDPWDNRTVSVKAPPAVEFESLLSHPAWTEA